MKAKKARIYEMKKAGLYDHTKDDFYNQEALIDSLDEDMISSEEQGFMMGYLGDEHA